MNDRLEFIKRFCVLSKLSTDPVVAKHEDLVLVFVRGYPMTLRGFYTLTSKAVFDQALRLPLATWKELHAETQVLTQGLNLEFEPDQEAYKVYQAIQAAMEWTIEKAKDNRYAVLDWIESVELEIIRLGQLPQ